MISISRIVQPEDSSGIPLDSTFMFSLGWNVGECVRTYVYALSSRKIGTGAAR